MKLSMGTVWKSVCEERAEPLWLCQVRLLATCDN